ncbi:hypothetical protein ACEPAH_1626 [Sanghuangporus vaninii]
MFTETFLNGNFFWVYASLPAILLVVHIVPYLIDSHHIRANGVTGPILARFSDIWLGWVATRARRSEVVHALHKKYGPFVRLAPNQVSISDPDAIKVVYAHGNGPTKSDYYDVFVVVRANIFSTKSRVEHARKRKVISHAFSQQSILGFERYIRQHVAELLDRWDKLCEGGQKGLSGTEAEGWQGCLGRVWFNCMPWFSYWAFDVIGDLAFGSPFGMIRNARDVARIAVDPEAAMANYGVVKNETVDESKPVCAVKEIPAVQILNDRAVPSLGVLPPWIRPFALRSPWYSVGKEAGEGLVGMAIAAVAKRLVFPTDRTDILSKLQQGKDEEGKRLSNEELTVEALAQLVAGSDTISKQVSIHSSIKANPKVQLKLQKELDDALGVDSSDGPVPTYSQVKNLPYLEAVINEGMRLHSTIGLGLPRVVPEGGLTVCGKTFPEGTVLSVPMYTVHRDPEVWGADADVFRPERWFELDAVKLQKSFYPFSFGPRACVGRNLAMTELLLVISSISHRYDIVLEQPGIPLDVQEGLVRKPVSCRVGLKLRNDKIVSDC